MSNVEHTYKEAGVDLDAAIDVKKSIQGISGSTWSPSVLSAEGAFGAMYRLTGFQEPILVSRTDGIGTKILLAAELGKYRTIGEDLVHACVNDIIVSGAMPIFFLDYIAVGSLKPTVLEEMIQGMADACVSVRCSLVGGETAQLPGLYAPDSFDAAGFVVGAVEKSELVDGSTVTSGDVVLGITSNGLHTNGYSLARDVLGLDNNMAALSERCVGLPGTVGEALVAPHRSYYSEAKALRPLVKAMAHITGGGLVENVPRVIPENLGVRLDPRTWKAPPIFKILREKGGVSEDEMYRVFNMGLGFVLVCDKSLAAEALSLVPEAMVVGEVLEFTSGQRVVLDKFL